MAVRVGGVLLEVLRADGEWERADGVVRRDALDAGGAYVEAVDGIVAPRFCEYAVFMRCAGAEAALADGEFCV